MLPEKELLFVLVIVVPLTGNRREQKTSIRRVRAFPLTGEAFEAVRPGPWSISRTDQWDRRMLVWGRNYQRRVVKEGTGGERLTVPALGTVHAALC